MNTESKQNKIFGTIRYIAGVLGVLSVLFAILTATGVVGWFLIDVIQYTKPYTEETKFVQSLTSGILGVFFLFIAFSPQIDKFFTYLETHRVKTDRKADTPGVSIESIFFAVIAIGLITLALLLGTGTLVLRTDLPFLGSATKTVLIVLLVVLAIFSLLTAFNRIISQSIKEMKKVHWPTGSEMIDYSKKVFTFIIFFSIFFFALDLLLTYIPMLVEKIF